MGTRRLPETCRPAGRTETCCALCCSANCRAAASSCCSSPCTLCSGLDSLHPALLAVQPRHPKVCYGRSSSEEACLPGRCLLQHGLLTLLPFSECCKKICSRFCWCSTSPAAAHMISLTLLISAGRSEIRMLTYCPPGAVSTQPVWPDPWLPGDQQLSWPDHCQRDLLECQAGPCNAMATVCSAFLLPETSLAARRQAVCLEPEASFFQCLWEATPAVNAAGNPQRPR